MHKKRFSKDYYALMKRNKKKILNLAKESAGDPWDWQPMISLLVAQLEFMRDYYKNGENVQAKENFEWDEKAIQKSRLKMIEEILNEYYEWMNCEDKYYKLIEHPETYKIEKTKDGLFVIKDFGAHLEYSLGDEALTGKAFQEEEKFHRKNFFELLSEYIEELWD